MEEATTEDIEVFIASRNLDARAQQETKRKAELKANMKARRGKR